LETNGKNVPEKRLVGICSQAAGRSGNPFFKDLIEIDTMEDLSSQFLPVIFTFIKMWPDRVEFLEALVKREYEGNVFVSSKHNF
jgi:hypothetical protein